MSPRFSTPFALLRLVFCFAVCGLGVLAQSQSFGDLAKQSTAPAIQNAFSLLSTLNSSTLPWQVAPLRKSILYARDMLDFFEAAFPNNTAVEQIPTDVWIILRQDLNVGYTVIGVFQDLNHSGVPYSAHDMETKRTVCLQWLDRFMADNTLFDFVAFASNPSVDTLYSHDKASLFFWGGDAQTQPDLNLSGLQNMAALANGLLVNAIASFNSVMELQRIWTPERHATFHDYRKLTRGVLGLQQFFPQIWNMTLDSPHARCNASAAFNQTQYLYDTFGDINDIITSYDFFTQHSDAGRAHRQQEKIVVQWDALVAYLRTSLMTHQFACLIQRLIPF